MSKGTTFLEPFTVDLVFIKLKASSVSGKDHQCKRQWLMCVTNQIEASLSRFLPPTLRGSVLNRPSWEERSLAASYFQLAFPQEAGISVIFRDYSLPFALLKIWLIFQELTVALDALVNGSSWCREKRKMEICESIQMFS